MAFAIFYNLDDLQGLGAGISRADIPQADKQLALSFWNAGVSGFAAAPTAPEQYRCVDTPDGQICDANCRVLVIDGKHQGQTLTLAQFRALLTRLSTSLNAPVLSALAKDMAGAQGAKEPWP